MKNMEYTIPTTEGGSPLPLCGYTTDWPIEITMGYTIEDLLQKFGYRIQDALRTPFYGKTGLDGQTMKNKTKWWKFWNRDLRKAYIWYTGEVYYEQQQPDYIFHNSMAHAQPSEEFINHWNNSNEEYSEKPVNPDYYMTLKLMNDYINTLKTDPPSEVFPTLAPEHHENSAVKKKIQIGKEHIKPGYILAPYVLVNRTEPNPEYDEFMKKYNKEHSCCPKCGSDDIITSLMGYPLYMDHKEDYKDLNAVYCEKCGYNGIQHDLVPKKRIKLPSPRMKKIHKHTYELDGGPCTKCGLTVAETIHEEITNYNIVEKKRKTGKTTVNKIITNKRNGKSK